ncbi:class I SAM-dependent methyltransferase [Nonomuraea sp. NPDC049400]|uniref:class I SAM-dependent methyltransferase n=1 Tax=Nonomuraea sp. NPDC049400 TaxID=3364352 RepID=UPI00379D6769
MLDLGCGDAAIGQVLLNASCRSYLGLDGSAAMVEAGNAALRGTSGRVELADIIEDFSAPPSSFDLIVSRLAFHRASTAWRPVLHGGEETRNVIQHSAYT